MEQGPLIVTRPVPGVALLTVNRPEVHNALDTGLTDADLNVVVAGKPDAILLPKAEGGAAVIHLDAKLTAREAMHGLPEPDTGVIALKNEMAMPFGESTNSSWLRAGRGKLLQRPHDAALPGGLGEEFGSTLGKP